MDLFDILLFSGEKPAGLHHDQTSDGNQFTTHLGMGQTMTFLPILWIPQNFLIRFQRNTK